MRGWFSLLERRDDFGRPRGGRFRVLPGRVALLVTIASAIFGCESGSFMPPVNPELRGEAGATPVAVTDSRLAPTASDAGPAPARPIELVLARRDPDDAEVTKTAARAQAGFDKIKLHIATVAVDEPDSKQADLVREALARHPRVLIVEPAVPVKPDLVAAVDSASREGTPVVVVGQPLAAAPADGNNQPKSAESGGGKGATVRIEPQFTSSANQIVAATIRVTEVSTLTPGGGALIVINTTGDVYLPQRVLAIKDALKAAGITAVEEVRCGRDLKAGEKLVIERLQAHPKIHMLFGVDSTSSQIVREAVNSDLPGRLLIAGCFTTEDQVATLTRMPNFAAVADFTPGRVIRKAISTAVALTQGKEIAPLIEFRIGIIESAVKSDYLYQQFLNKKPPDTSEAKGAPGERRKPLGKGKPPG